MVVTLHSLSLFAFVCFIYLRILALNFFDVYMIVSLLASPLVGLLPMVLVLLPTQLTLFVEEWWWPLVKQSNIRAPWMHSLKCWRMRVPCLSSRVLVQILVFFLLSFSLLDLCYDYYSLYLIISYWFWKLFDHMEKDIILTNFC